MLEILLCSLVTILPDFLFRRYGQGKRIGHEITLFSVWYELRWGLTGCLILAIMLFTVVFYYHPAADRVTSFFRTVAVVPERGGRVEEVLADNGTRVEAGQVIFRLEASRQQAAVEASRARLAEAEAGMVLAQSELAAATGMIAQARGTLDAAEQELGRKSAVNEKNANVVSASELDRLRATADSARGALSAAEAQRDLVQSKIDALLPAQRASAAAALAEAEAELERMTVRAGVTGELVQFALRTGDFVSPFRPAGIMVPEGAGRTFFQASFPQVVAQVLHPGMVAEIACASLPFTVIPMVITEVQPVIAAGQFRPTEQLVEGGGRAPGSITVHMRPLHPGQADRVPPGSACLGMAYTSNHERPERGDLDTGTRLFLHAVDTVGVVHAAGLRIKALLMPVTTLVLSGH